MKRIVILLLVFLVLAGGAGGAAWWFLLREPEGELEVVEEPVVESAFIEFLPMILPIIEKGRITSQVTMTVVIELPEGEDQNRAEMYKPKLRDLFFSELHALFALKYVTDRGYDGEIVKKRLMTVAEKIVGRDVLRGIELQKSNYPS
ncbi:hypothetical protein [Pelagibius sp. Alg239-R121]|uniref:hypothetical protein n=1 Tax=Pelagibius sp. Alg239-R121 TaxID=2993448 RepID=UPI0024A6D535|nr:hypothetical protein [Pelagibius sp. Alg239-R121]